MCNIHTYIQTYKHTSAGISVVNFVRTTPLLEIYSFEIHCQFLWGLSLWAVWGILTGSGQPEHSHGGWWLQEQELQLPRQTLHHLSWDSLEVIHCRSPGFQGRHIDPTFWWTESKLCWNYHRGWEIMFWLQLKKKIFSMLQKVCINLYFHWAWLEYHFPMLFANSFGERWLPCYWFDLHF